ncbi:hypothetical protein EVAR_60297_1 [Eumeta japonica]|uniref:Uncharacterized protein n=1 Tax=Eumeta variegata TaxID=151549 RepID=A0A4C1ZLE7_EUMVA|nr:hypothetical protein EVAR_60297_1 [Eumeta japonica]
MTSASSIATLAAIGAFKLTVSRDCDGFAALEALTFCDAGASWEFVFQSVSQEDVDGSAFAGDAAVGAAGVTEGATGEAEGEAFGFLPDRQMKSGSYVLKSRGWRPSAFGPE